MPYGSLVFFDPLQFQQPSCLITNLLNPCREEIVKEKFQQLGEIKKIKHTNKHKIFDFIMKERKILIEVTSTNLIFPYKKERIIPSDILQNNYPEAFNYFLSNTNSISRSNI